MCAIDSLQSSLDSETRSKIETTWLKRNMEGDLNEMELQLSCTNWWVSEATKSLDQLQTEIKVFSSCNIGWGMPLIMEANQSTDCIEQYKWGHKSNFSREWRHAYI